MHAFIISYQHLPNQKSYQHLRSHCVETTGSQHRQRGDTQQTRSGASAEQEGSNKMDIADRWDAKQDLGLAMKLCLWNWRLMWRRWTQ